MRQRKTVLLFYLLLILVTIVFVNNCSSSGDEAESDEVPAPGGPSDISFWGYQLQNADPVQIANSDFDLVVFDYSRTGEADGEYSSEEITGIKDKKVIPIAYISIGEAENYRFYWNADWTNNPPEWLGKENPEWQGNYKVKYWMDGWKSVVFSYLDRILAQGYSGVYLDIVDGFEYWADDEIKKDVNLTEEDSAQKMIVFIKEIAEYCRGVAGKEFMIIPQNGERIIDYDYKSDFVNAISGIGIEDLFFNETDEIAKSEKDFRIGFIDRIKANDKYVFSVDYVDDGSGYSGKNRDRIDAYRDLCKKRGYIPYPAISDRELDELNDLN